MRYYLKSILFFYFLINSLTIFSQDLEWTFQYSTDHSYRTTFGIIANELGDYIFETGFVNSTINMQTGEEINLPGSSFAFYINKFSSEGDLIWSRIYDTNNRFYLRNFGVRGNEIIVIGVDKGISNINETPLENTIYHNFGNAILLRFDQNGNFIGHVENPNTVSNMGNDWSFIAMNENGNIALGGYRFYNSVNKNLYTLLNPDFEIIYSLEEFGIPLDIEIDKFNNVHTLIKYDDNEYHLNKYDPAGKLIWRYITRLNVKYLEMLNDNSIALLGNSTQATTFNNISISSADSYLIKVDPKGKLRDFKLIKNLKAHTMGKNQNNLLIAGNPSGQLKIDSLAYKPVGSSDLYLTALDESFKAQWDYSFQNINEVNRNIEFNHVNNVYFSSSKLDSSVITSNCGNTEVLYNERTKFMAKISGPDVQINTPMYGCVNAEISVDFTESATFQFEQWEILYNDSVNTEFTSESTSKIKFTPDKKGYYYVELTGLSTSQCESKRIRLYRQIFVNDIMSTPDLIINGDSKVCSPGYVNLETPDVANVERMIWTMPEGVRMPQQKDYGNQYLIIEENFSSGYVELKAENYCDQITFEPKLLRVESLPDSFIVNSSKQLLCPGDTVDFFVDPVEDVDQYIWHFDTAPGSGFIKYANSYPDEPTRNNIINQGLNADVNLKAIVYLKGKCEISNSKSNSINFIGQAAPPQLKPMLLDYCKGDIVEMRNVMNTFSWTAKNVYWEFDYTNQGNLKDTVEANSNYIHQFEITEDVYLSGYTETLCEISGKSEPVFLNVINDFEFSAPEILPGSFIKCSSDNNPVLAVMPENYDLGYIWKISPSTNYSSFNRVSYVPEFIYDFNFDANVSVARIMECDTSQFSTPVFVDIFEYNNVYKPVISKNCFTLTAVASYEIDWFLDGINYKSGSVLELELPGEYTAQVTTECGVYSTSISILEGIIDKRVRVYNSRSGSNFNISRDLMGSSVKIYTVDGSLMYKNDNYLNNKDLSEFSEGIYIYIISSVCDGKDYTGKFIVN
ncbi:MAG: T9SS type A sorting domain-containing protein [Cyclobacteriaceae bacterium]|nr:T9SS type A sorting domain-containing protein [Cyclobacteriaceae bacterium]